VPGPPRDQRRLVFGIKPLSKIQQIAGCSPIGGMVNVRP
jgi:hypothetical protein